MFTKRIIADKAILFSMKERYESKSQDTYVEEHFLGSHLSIFIMYTQVCDERCICSCPLCHGECWHITYLLKYQKTILLLFRERCGIDRIPVMHLIIYEKYELL
jgi:hypothetical protein